MNEISNHLWQTTLFAIGVAALCLVLRRNPARLRFWLWMAASAKFAVPFSLLASLGSKLEAPAGGPQIPRVAVEQLAASFEPLSLVVPEAGTSWWPPVLAAVWLAGTLVVLGRWLRQWLVIRVALRTAVAVSIPAPIPVLTSRTAIEPGVFGIFRPVLLLPEGITARLSVEELDAILTHEITHVRHRDNLTAALHMVVAAVFWFHPLVWWIGIRLIEERERACDEEVLRLGTRPQAYAEGILTVCKFYVESPLPCAPGVTGADLKRRIAEIMSVRVTRRLSLSRLLLLAAAGFIAITIPVGIGVLRAQPKADTLKFDVASIRPSDPNSPGQVSLSPDDGLRANGISLRFLIAFAYGIEDFQISGGPAWIQTDRFDVIAKPEATSRSHGDSHPADSVQQNRGERLRERTRTLLAERFQLQVRRDAKTASIYTLRQAKTGHKLKDSTDGRGIHRNRGLIEGRAAPMAMLVKVLSGVLGRPVVDHTDLKGKYDLKLEWAEDSTGTGKEGATPQAQEPAGPSIFTAIQEQLGLKLESTSGPIEIIVIERAEKPSEN